MRATAPFCFLLDGHLFSKRRTATLIQKLPWIGTLAVHVARRLQPWITAGVVGAVFNDQGQLLLVEHVFHTPNPWGLPGGWMAPNEDPEETVRRELWEETALNIDVIKPLVITRSPKMRHHLDLAYLCHIPGEPHDLKLSSELLDYRWIDPTDPPPLPVFHRRAIKAALAEREMLRK
jgi:8-oxo-dGTP diphosphatase